MTTKVAVVGASGRLGREAARLIEDAGEFDLVASLGSTTPLSDVLGADVVLDVTVPSVSASVVEFAVSNGINVLVGTSGWSADRIAILSERMRELPDTGVVIVPNFSLGSALASAFAVAAGRFYDSIEIVEAHGAGKVDSPSGTAVRTAELIAAARGERGPVEAAHTDQRARGQQVAGIPVHSLRLAGLAARQEVILAGSGETVTIRHDTTGAEAYAAGILLGLRAAVQARGVTVGLDNLIDLGLGSAVHGA